MARTSTTRLVCRAATVGALAVIGSHAANATAYGFADNQVGNFQILVLSGDVAVQNATRSTVNTANYNGVGESFADPEPLPNASNATQAVAGPGPFPTQNNFSISPGLAIGQVGTRSDSRTTSGSPFVASGGTVSAGGGTGVASVQNAAEGIATGVSTGNSDGRNTSTANFTIAVASGTTVQFSFDNAVNLAASTAFPTESAIATIANALTIQDPNAS